jgi:hypothetical protein
MDMNTDGYPLAYFITWTTYGTWLPGDERGWRKHGSYVVEAPDPALRETASRAMTGEPVVLSDTQRDAVDAVIVRHCAIRGWVLHARNVRSNHVHVVVSAGIAGDVVRAQLKAWCSRRLSEQAGMIGAGKNGQARWFSERGDVAYIDDDDQLRDATTYVNEYQ